MTADWIDDEAWPLIGAAGVAGPSAGATSPPAVRRPRFLFLTLVPISAIPLPRSAPDEGRAREASQCGSRHGPVTGLANLSTGGPGCVPLNRDWSQAPADVAVPAWRSHRTGTACPPKKAVREAASRLFHHTMIIEPGCPSRHPRSKGSEPKRLRAHGAPYAGPEVVRRERLPRHLSICEWAPKVLNQRHIRKGTGSSPQGF